MWLVLSPLKSQELFGDGSRQDLRKRPISLWCDEPQVDQLNLKARIGVPSLMYLAKVEM
jgi:hypothetical protein